jgi:2,3-bisphosphoglycerate-dependent phosphoglycerate mutase
MASLKIVIIRHAQSEGNHAGRMMGQLDDGLTAEGRNQARCLADHLGQTSDSPTAIYSSPLTRAAETADILAAPFNLEVHHWDALQELHAGVFEGLTWREAQEQHPHLCQSLETSTRWIPIPNAESPYDAYQRAIGVWNDLFAEHRNGDYVWLISHAGVMQHLISVVLGGDRTWGLHIPNTSLFEFWLDHERWFTHGCDRWNTELWRIRRFNDTQHLPQ